MASSVLLVNSDGWWKLTLTLSILSFWVRFILLLNCSCCILIWRTIIMASITHGQRYRNVTLPLNYVPHCVPSNQTASNEKSSEQQPFNQSWQTSRRRDTHASLLPLPTPELITTAHSTSPIVGLPRRGGDFSSHVWLLVLSMSKTFPPWTPVPVNGSGAVRLPSGCACYYLIG